MTKKHEEYIRQKIRETDNDTVAMGLELYLFYERYGIKEQPEENEIKKEDEQ